VVEAGAKQLQKPRRLYPTAQEELPEDPCTVNTLFNKRFNTKRSNQVLYRPFTGAATYISEAEMGLPTTTKSADIYDMPTA